MTKDQYPTECPKCSGPLEFVTGMIGCVGVRMSPDGFDLMDAKEIHTWDEHVGCADCRSIYKLSTMEPVH